MLLSLIKDCKRINLCTHTDTKRKAIRIILMSWKQPRFTLDAAWGLVCRTVENVINLYISNHHIFQKGSILQRFSCFMINVSIFIKNQCIGVLLHITKHIFSTKCHCTSLSKTSYVHSRLHCWPALYIDRCYHLCWPNFDHLIRHTIYNGHRHHISGNILRTKIGSIES